MRSHDKVHARPGWLRRVPVLLAAAAVAALASGCTQQVKTGWLPSTPETTNQTARVIDLWNGSWIAALAVGVVVWGLILWCVVVYRRRRDDDPLPLQVRYNLPIEILYTALPLMMVGVLFYFTARDEAAIAATDHKPDLTINVVGEQWSWDFNYVDADVWDAGLQGELHGKPGVEKELPTLYLPVNERVQFDLTSRDVIHSFWIPAFLYKLDIIPGLTNKFQVIPQREGTFQGKCAELCGEYHSAMLFNVAVVSRAVFDQHMADLRARGQTGQLPTDLGRARTPQELESGSQ